MGKSIEVRLNGNIKEFLDDVKYYGTWYAMEKWGIKDYVACRKFIEKKTGDSDYGINPKFELSPGRDIGAQILQAIKDEIIRSRAREEELDKKIAYLEYQLHLESLKNKTKAIEILEMLDT